MAKINLLNSVKMTRPKKSVFDLTHDVKLSCNMGQLVPVLIQEVIPSDKFKVANEAFARYQPMVAPMMHRTDVSFHTFFVPYRILWPNWDKWITNQKVAGALPAHPYIKLSDTGVGTYAIQNGSLGDYLGLPLTSGSTAETNVSALPFAAYQMIYNEYYRDQNLIDPIDFELIDGDNTTNALVLGALRKRAWEHDYFTACAPSAQAGEAVELPIGQFNDVPVGINVDPATAPPGFTNLQGTPYDQLVTFEQTADVPNGTMYADTSNLQAQATTINDLRTAFRLQEWLEKSMRGGKRLFENILVFFGLRSPDSRLQRPEYISGSKTPIQISEVLNTTGTTEAPQGSMAGHAIGVVNPKDGVYNVQEWGVIITIMSIMPRTAYQQGIPKMWSKITDPMEIFWPQFDHLGEQAVKLKELYAYTPDDEETFGYLPMYTEYKVPYNRVAGDFRTSLDFWHMGRIFESAPALNQEFVEADPTHRVFAVTDPNEQKVLVHVVNRVMAIRPMSKYSTPTF